MALPLLVPQPKTLAPGKGVLRLPARGWIVDAGGEDFQIFAARQIKSALQGHGLHWKIVRDPRPMDAAAEIRLEAADLGHPQAYVLDVTARGILVRGAAAGLFHGTQTLLQLLRQFGPRPPLLHIEDRPDFERRGFYHDVSRGKVPKLETLLTLVDDLAALKINEFQLYIENVYEFRRHPDMYDDTTPLTAEDLLTLDAACRERFIDFVPSLTSLGHFEKILKRPAYRALAEAEPAELKAQGIETWSEDPWSLCVTDPRAKQLLEDMYEEFLPNFSSTLFNICCDESWDLGKGRSREEDQRLGPGRLYVDWVNFCHALARRQQLRIQMWGDIILRHPERLNDLPQDAILLEWGYEANHQFDEHAAVFGKSGKAFYVCPGTSSWLTFAGRTKNAFGCIKAAANAGLKNGAAGLLNTDWGDNGHQQLLAVSLLPMAFGAAAAWNAKATGEQGPELKTFLRAASLHLFRDETLQFADAAYQLGLTYERLGWQRFNASADWFLFREKWDFANYVNRITPANLAKVSEACEKLVPHFQKATLHRPDAAVIKAEFVFTAREIIHTLRRTRARQLWLAADPAKRNPDHETLRNKKPVPLDKRTFAATVKRLAADAAALEKEFQRLWLARNKRSRLADVTAEFERLRKEYQAVLK